MADRSALNHSSSPPDRGGLWTRRASLLDHLLERAAFAERAGRAILRRLTAGTAPLRTDDRLRGSAPHRERLSGPAPAAPLTGASKRPLLILPAIPWQERFQRPQQLALALAGGCQLVLWVEGFLRTRIQPAVWVTSPHPDLRVVRLRLPDRPDPFRQPFPARAVSAAVDRLLPAGCEAPLAVVAQLPFWAPLAERLSERAGCPLIYDRIDLHTAFPGVPPAVGEVETALLRRCDLVTATSPHLAELSREHAKRVRWLPNAAQVEQFSPAPWRDPSDGTTAGFVGALDERIDGESILAVAASLPHWRFRFAGRVEDPSLQRLAQPPNIELLGELAHQEVADFLSQLDVGFIPYRDSPLTRAIDPVKLYELLATGLPVALRELAPGPAQGVDPERRPPRVYPYRAPETLADILDRARREDTPHRRAERVSWAGEQSWRQRAADLLRAIEDLGSYG